ncbi:MAG: extracellular solute-binding protein [Pseudomonadota bacterium]
MIRRGCLTLIRCFARPDAASLKSVVFAAAVCAAAVAPAYANDQDLIRSHGYSFFGELKYPADFTHFDYVNPNAPKGGEISIAIPGTFDSMNPYTRNGRAAALSSVMYESLLDSDAPSDVIGEDYGLLAESIEYPADKSWVIFNMRPEARFSNGEQVTAHDVAFSHNLLLDQGLQSYAEAVRKRIPKVEVIDDLTIKFYFAEGISRRNLIDQVGAVPVWSKKWFEETGARIDEPRMETSPGSGPYVVDTIDPNRRVIYKRNPDYWGRDLAVNKGRHNFDAIRLEYFADATAAFEAFKAGEVTYRTERDPKIWAAGYEFPASKNGYVKKEEIPNGSPPPMSGIVFNLGSEVFSDKRVRQAVALMFNFEWTNKSLLYGLYAQQRSFSTGTKLEATGLPDENELAFLEALETPVPGEILTAEPWVPHESNADRLMNRRNKAQALDLLAEAGFEVGDDGKIRTADGAQMRLNFLFNSSGSPTDRAVAENFVSNLQSLGIDARFEAVDASQFTDRERNRDYDLIFDGYPALLGTGTGLAQRLGSEAAAFSLFNPAGLASPLVDEIIELSLLTDSQAEEDMTVRALDRALRHEFFIIPDGYAPNHWAAYWDMYGRPEVIPPFNLGTLDFWWFDQQKSDRLKQAGAL